VGFHLEVLFFWCMFWLHHSKTNREPRERLEANANALDAALT
jgi:hypothetical protein